MTFTVNPLQYHVRRPPLAVERTLRQVGPDRHVDFRDFYEQIRDGRNFVIGGPRGCGKTSLLNEIASVQPERTIGPLSIHSIQAELPKTPWDRATGSILLLIDDVDSVPVAECESLLRHLQVLLGPRTSFGLAGNLFEDEMSFESLGESDRYLLGPFTLREIREFFRKLDESYRCIFPVEGLGYLSSWTGYTPYFVQALMLSLAVSNKPKPDGSISVASVDAAGADIPPPLISNFARSLTRLTDRARDDAQELLNLLIRNGSTAVDWNYSVVRDLKRWGLVTRDSLDWMTWSTPLLQRWFERAGSAFLRIDDLHWDTENVAAIEERGAKFLSASQVLANARRTVLDESRFPPMKMGPEVMAVTLRKETGEDLLQSIVTGLGLGSEHPDPDPSGVLIKRESAIDVLNALVTNLGAVPMGKGKEVYEVEPPEPEAERQTKRAKPPAPQPAAATTTQPSQTAAGLSRYINLWFTEKRSDDSPIDKTFALEHNAPVYLRVNIGPLDSRTTMNVKKAVAFPSEKTIGEAFPETAGKPVPLEASIFTNDFEIPENARTQKFDLLPGQPSKPIFFPLIPRSKTRARLRLCVFYRNHLLQSMSLTAAVKRNAGKGRFPQTAIVETTFSADFSNVTSLPARALWLGINQGADDTHSLNLKSSEKALSRDLQSKIEKALLIARQALLDVSFDLKTEKGEQKKVYRFNSQNFPNGDADGYRARLRDDLTRLAAAGNRLYQAIFGFVPTAEERETVWPIVKELQAALRDEQTIQIARLKRMDDIWPWAMIYEAPIDIKGVKDVCMSYRGKDGPLPYSEGAKLCQHADDDETIVCPYQFWGFKHIIEQPTQPGGKKAFNGQNLALEIKVSGAPVYRMLLNNTLGQLEKDHVTNMKTLKFTTLASLADITAALNPAAKPPPVEPHLMYFFCHGKSDEVQGPYLSVGADESLLPAKLDRWDFRWPNSHGLVFINGCHTVDLNPSELSSIMQPFVEAGASGIIGTEISVTTGLAREFAYEFFERLLDTSSNKHDNHVGQIIKDLRLKLLMKYNPLGLVYTPYCSADLHVTV